ncbi:MAG TPA: glutaredoxin family protein [Chthoniobacteraceae bacterium]|jgi:glutaredoxin|nr:glutaredoxin family protein [Chthoniobacteraceae bacterium]
MSLKLYVKTWCPWCVMAIRALDEKGYRYELIDVESSRGLYDEMIKLSGQRYTPTLTVGELVLPDFGPDELASFLQAHGIKP